MERLFKKFNLSDNRSLEMVRKSYEVYLVDEPVLEKRLERFASDIRLKQREYRDNSISFLVESKSKRRPVFAFTFFEINSDNSNLATFWHHNKEGARLEQVKLAQLLGDIKEPILTPGLVFSTEERAFELTLLYNESFNRLLDLYEGAAYLEIEGVKLLKKRLLKMAEIPLDLRRPPVKKENFGRINRLSRTALEFAQITGFKEMENLYNIYTLGKVFFSEALNNLYQGNSGGIGVTSFETAQL